MDCFDYLIKRKKNPTIKRIKAIVQFQIANGMRIRALLAIKKDNINFEYKSLDIDDTIN
ncbi:Integrase [Staphylococcus schweitzeri]|nr:Integrase [Staphylococcus schweitzeri]